MEPDRMFGLKVVESSWIPYLGADELLLPTFREDLRYAVEVLDGDPSASAAAVVRADFDKGPGAFLEKRSDKAV